MRTSEFNFNYCCRLRVEVGQKMLKRFKIRKKNGKISKFRKNSEKIYSTLSRSTCKRVFQLKVVTKKLHSSDCISHSISLRVYKLSQFLFSDSNKPKNQHFEALSWKKCT